MKILKNKLVVSKISWEEGKEDLIVSALYQKDQCVEVSCERESSSFVLGNIYVGKVQNIVKNIHAAFIEIGTETPCYYSLEDYENVLFTHRQSPKKLSIGDELLVQVSKENIKTKAPVVTTNLNIPGLYLVVTTGNRRLGLSSKLDDKEKKRLKKLMEPYAKEDGVGVVIRTNAKGVSKEVLLKEYESLKKKCQDIIDKGSHSLASTCLLKAPSQYVKNLQNIPHNSIEEIVTDNKILYSEMEAFLEQLGEGMPPLRLYEDPLLPLEKLYSLKSTLKNLLKERVWMKSGAYLIIQQTEACVVVDVNTGKFSGKKKSEETFLKINLEAAMEIAKQIRLRNLSGIIIIDFIDMIDPENNQLLMEEFSKYLKNDPIVTQVMGMTNLHMVEVTRKKTKKSLREELIEPCPVCQGRGYLY